MIISHTHKYIFLRPRKIAGSSIQMALMPYLQSGDTASILPAEEAAAVTTNPGFEAGKFRSKGLLTLRSHSELGRAYRIYGPELHEYRVISATRNPWDRAVSHFYWLVQDTPIMTETFDLRREAFAAFIRKSTKIRLKHAILDRVEGRERTNDLCQAVLYHIKGQNKADRVIRFENLADDLRETGEFLGLPDIATLPAKKAKSGVRPTEKRHWREYFNAETQNIVAHCCKLEIGMFGYTFED